MAAERVQKILAQAGIASRRKAEEMIQEGLVTINGKVAQLGDKAEWGKDAIKVKGKLLRQAETLVYLAFNKPRGVISMLADPEGRATLADFLHKVHERVFPVGRLDFNSEGLILLTNDGAFAEKVQKSSSIPRVYHVKIKGHPDREMLSRLERGMRQGSKLLKPFSVRLVQKLNQKAVVEIIVMGAGAFDLKTLFETKGFLVEKITRTAIGHLTLKDTSPGEFRLLKASQAEALLTQPELGMRRIEFEKQGARDLLQMSPREELAAQKRLEAKLPAPSGSQIIRSKAAPARGARPTAKITLRSDRKPAISLRKKHER